MPDKPLANGMSRGRPRSGGCGLPLGEGGQAPVSRPVEGRPRIRLPARRDLLVASQARDRIAPAQRARESAEHPVLCIRVGQQVCAFQLDANRKIVAPLAALP